MYSESCPQQSEQLAAKLQDFQVDEGRIQERVLARLTQQTGGGQQSALFNAVDRIVELRVVPEMRNIAAEQTEQRLAESRALQQLIDERVCALFAEKEKDNVSESFRSWRTIFS